MSTVIDRISQDDLWNKDRHGCWSRQFSAKVRLDCWEASGLLVVKRINKRGDWVTVRYGSHDDLDRAIYHAELVARQHGGDS